MDQFHYWVSFEFPDHDAPLMLGYLGFISITDSTFLMFSFPLRDDEDQDALIQKLVERVNGKYRYKRQIKHEDIRIIALTFQGYSHTKFDDTFRRARERTKEVAEGNEFWWRTPKVAKKKEE